MQGVSLYLGVGKINANDPCLGLGFSLSQSKGTQCFRAALSLPHAFPFPQGAWVDIFSPDDQQSCFGKARSSLCIICIAYISIFVSFVLRVVLVIVDQLFIFSLFIFSLYNVFLFHLYLSFGIFLFYYLSIIIFLYFLLKLSI